MAKKKKPKLERTAREITAIIERFLSKLPPEEQDRRVENFAAGASRRREARHEKADRKQTDLRRSTPARD
jgi:hypothetical protein